MVAALTEDRLMKISARNQIPGTVVAVTDGAVNGNVKIDIGGGIVVTSSITNEAIADLGLETGDTVTVIIKATDVLIGK
jgi:molybdopterin-binding protein